MAEQLNLTYRNHLTTPRKARIAWALIGAAVAALPVWGAQATGADPSVQQFQNPPDAAKPRTWFHWMNGDVTADGITKDLEAMKAIGLGGAQIFSVNTAAQDLIKPPVIANTPEWRQMVKHSAEMCDKLGLELAFQNTAGWSETGGPWITPDKSMQKLVWSRLDVTGPQTFSVQLPKPPDIPGEYMEMPRQYHSPKYYSIPKPYYADSAVVAYLLPPADAAPGAQAVPTVTFSKDFADASAGAMLVGEKPGDAVNLLVSDEKKQEAQYINYAYAEPFTCRSFVFQGELSHFYGTLEVSDDDGKSYRKLLELPNKTASSDTIPRTFAIAPVTSRYYRLAVTRLNAKTKTYPINKAYPSGVASVDRWQEKAGFTLIRTFACYGEANTPAYGNDCVIPARQVIDLTSRLKPDGTLTWTVPAGKWCIMRFGHSPTGKLNGPADLPATGLECDKLDPDAVAFHFHAVMDPLKQDLGPLFGKSLRATVMDSWEAGNTNWTEKFIVDFKRLRGYDPTPYLPVLAGRVVESNDVSERFLWDIRRTIADLIADAHYGTFTKLAHQDGLQVYAEAIGIGQGMADQLQCKGRVDMPMGEFWTTNSQQRWGPTQDPREGADAAHIYGKPIVAAESFTSGFTHNAWQWHPYRMKGMADINFCQGVNRFCFHTYSHQPLVDAKPPGYTMWRFGIHQERTVTWWDNAGPLWMTYLSRCEEMLQRGLFSADLAYFYGEGAPNTIKERFDLPLPKRTHNYDEDRGVFKPTPPIGYDYDALNAEVLLTRASVKDGRIVLPDGMSYRVLILGDETHYTLPVAKKIQELVADGATIYGDRPGHSPSLADYPKADGEIAKIASDMWGGIDGKTVTEHAFGKGRVIWGKPFDQVLADLKLPQDFEYHSADPDSDWHYIHRTDGGTQIYFVANSREQADQATCTFRVDGKVPEFWHADTGQIEPVTVYSIKDGRTTLPVRLEPYGSVFVVFREAATTGAGIIAVSRDGKGILDGTVRAMPEPIAELRANNLWASQAGSYELTRADGQTRRIEVAGLPGPVEINGAWNVSFPPNLGAPASIMLDGLASLSKNENAGVKYFSGTATYSRSIDIPADRFGDGRAIMLDLGHVCDIPEVSLNGQSLGVLWKPPYRCDITKLAHAGTNQLQVKVTNMWPNRLIGDWNLPVDKRVTWTTYPDKSDSPLNKSTELQDSGLLGPVRVIPVARVPIP